MYHVKRSSSNFNAMNMGFLRCWRSCVVSPEIPRHLSPDHCIHFLASQRYSTSFPTQLYKKEEGDWHSWRSATPKLNSIHKPITDGMRPKNSLSVGNEARLSF